MTLTQERKQELIEKFGESPTDTGKAEVQIALLTERINDLTEHLARAQQGPPFAPRPADARRSPARGS